MIKRCYIFFRILLASGVNAKVMLKFVVKKVTSFEKLFKTGLINEMCYLHSCKLFSSHLYFTRDVFRRNARRPFNEWINIIGGFRGILPWSIIFLLPTLRVVASSYQRSSIHPGHLRIMYVLPVMSLEL